MRSPHVLAATCVLLSSKFAVADYTEVAPVRPLTGIDPSGLTMVGLDLQFTKWTERPPAPMPELDFTNITVDIAADIALAPHWVVLARIPMSHVSIDANGNSTDCCDLALGNVTLGGRGLWSSRFDNGMMAVAGGELSLSLPTASDGVDRGPSAAAGALAQLPHDPGLYAPNTTTIRLTTLAQLYGRWFLAHAEAGVQLYLFDDDVAGDSSDFAFRLALAVGIRATYKVAIIAELSSLLSSTDIFENGNDSVSSLDLGIRYGSGRLIAGLRFYYPIDSTLRDLDMIGAGLDVGVRF